MKLTNEAAMRRRDESLARVRQDGAALDISELPSFGFSHRSLMWWGTLGLMAIEGTVFALAIACYFYLRSQASRWPPAGMPPDLLWGTLNTVILVVSAWPNHWAKRASERLDFKAARLGLLLCLGFSIAFLLVRIFEFRTLNIRWDEDAYGSMVWILLALHTVHLLSDTVDTAVLTVLLHTGPLEATRLVDVSENALYWYFVVWSWLPVYAVIYLVPRLA
jgi:heme/copper-type cytochrome/quinol oxidase subunit 3